MALYTQFEGFRVTSLYARALVDCPPPCNCHAMHRKPKGRASSLNPVDSRAMHDGVDAAAGVGDAMGGDCIAPEVICRAAGPGTSSIFHAAGAVALRWEK